MSETGDECEKSGVYFGSGGCGHATERKIAKDQLFPECSACGKAVNWTFAAADGSRRVRTSGSRLNRDGDHQLLIALTA